MPSLHCDFLILEQTMSLCFCVCQHLFRFLAFAGFLGDSDRVRDTETETDMTGLAGSCLQKPNNWKAEAGGLP